MGHSTRKTLDVAAHYDDANTAAAADRANVPSSGIEVAAFPVEVFPSPLTDFVNESATAMNCPRDYIAVPMLGALGTAIGTQRRLEVKPGWVESALLTLAIIGDPGSTKSPALHRATEPLEATQNRFLAEYLEARRKHKEWAKEKAGPEPEQPEVPRQILSTDATIEALAMVLQANPHGVAYVQDELTAWVKRFNEYKRGNGADRQQWQSNWSGAPWVINRKIEPRLIVVSRPFVTVMGSIPPDMLNELSDEQGREDGFIHRILFSYPSQMALKWVDAGVSPELRAQYQCVFDGLRQLPISMIPASDGVVIQFTPDGREMFVQWVQEHYGEINDPRFPVYLRGPWRKMESYCVRLSLILHLTRVVCKEVTGWVDGESLVRAWTLVDYFKSHARKVYRELRSSLAEKRITAAVAWIERQAQREASVRDFLTHKVAGCENNEQVLLLFRQLERAGWGHMRERRPERGGRPSTVFRLKGDCRTIAEAIAE